MSFASRSLVLGGGGGATFSNFFAIQTDGTNFYRNAKVAVDSSGNIYTVMVSASNLFIVKYSTTGSIAWQKLFVSAGTGYNSLWPAFIDTDSSGNIYAAFTDTVSSNNRMTIVKLAPSGSVTWQKYFAGYRCSGLRVDSSDNIYITGFSYLTKMATDGSVVWTRGYNTALNAYVEQIAVDPSGNIYLPIVTDYVSSPATLDINKIDSSGTHVWTKRLSRSTATSTFGFFIDCDNSGNIYVFVLGLGTLIKFNSSGTSQYQVRAGGTFQPGSYQGDYSMAVNKNTGECYFGAMLNDAGAYWAGIYKVTSSGAHSWGRKLWLGTGSNSYNTVAGLKYSPSYGLFAAGALINSSTIARAWLANIPEDGTKTGAYSLEGNTLTYTTATSATSSMTDYTITAPTVSQISTTALTASNASYTPTNGSVTNYVTAI
jgi:hypothetical protein